MIIRVKKDKNNPYVIKSKHADNDAKLSFKAKGIHSFLMGLPDDWEINVTHLSRVSTDGKTSVREGLNELIEHGYVERVRDRLDGGKFGGVRYTVYEEPQIYLRKPQKQQNLPKSGFPDTGKPNTGKPDTGNRTQLYNDNTKKGSIVNKDSNNSFSSFFSKKSNKTERLDEVIKDIIPTVTGIGKNGQSKK